MLKAKTLMVLTLRATGMAMPQRINSDVSKPPARFPNAAVKYGIQPFPSDLLEAEMVDFSQIFRKPKHEEILTLDP